MGSLGGPIGHWSKYWGPGTWVLYDKRFRDFHYPVTDEDAPNYRSIVQNPMDIATLLQRVDCGQYITCSAFLQDFDLILTNAKTYNGDDYTGARIVSRAYELRDAMQGMLSQMDPALITYCDKISAQGGPVEPPDDIGGLVFPTTPVVQLPSVTRTSARLRHVQPEVNLSQSYEALKRQKKNMDTDQPGILYYFLLDSAVDGQITSNIYPFQFGCLGASTRIFFPASYE
ncbi:hypothetical protein GIB67_009167, partial [Kingdonia uniflora]